MKEEERILFFFAEKFYFFFEGGVLQHDELSTERGDVEIKKRKARREDETRHKTTIPTLKKSLQAIKGGWGGRREEKRG